MPPKAKEEDKLTVRKFKESNIDFWVEYLHLYLNENNEICFGA